MAEPAATVTSFWVIYGASSPYQLRRGGLDLSGLFTAWETAPIDTTVGLQVTAIAAHPTNPNIVFWATTDNGAAAMRLWRYDGGTVTNVKSVAFGGSNSSNAAINAIWLERDNESVWFTVGVYAIGAGDYSPFAGLGLYRSTDGGDTWTQPVSGTGANAHLVGTGGQGGRPGLWDVCVREVDSIGMGTARRVYICHQGDSSSVEPGAGHRGAMSFSDDEGASWTTFFGSGAGDEQFTDGRYGIIQAFPFLDGETIRWSFGHQNAQRYFYRFNPADSTMTFLRNTAPQGLAARGGHFYADALNPIHACFPAISGNNFAGLTDDNWATATFPSGWAGASAQLQQKTSIHAERTWQLAVSSLGAVRISIDYGVAWATISDVPATGRAAVFAGEEPPPPPGTVPRVTFLSLVRKGARGLV